MVAGGLFRSAWNSNKTACKKRFPPDGSELTAMTWRDLLAPTIHQVLGAPTPKPSATTPRIHEDGGGFDMRKKSDGNEEGDDADSQI